MIKAMLIVMAIGTGTNYTVEMPSMDECLDAKVLIARQDASLKTLCLPMEKDEQFNTKVRDFFDEFMKMIEKIKEKEELGRGYVCDSSVIPGLVIQTDPPRINCDE